MSTPFHEDPRNPPTCAFWEEFMHCRCPCKSEAAPPGAEMNPHFQKLVAAVQADPEERTLALAILNSERAQCSHPFPIRTPCRICGSTPVPRP